VTSEILDASPVIGRRSLPSAVGMLILVRSRYRRLDSAAVPKPAY